jgi:hypothetical protein
MDGEEGIAPLARASAGEIRQSQLAEAFKRDNPEAEVRLFDTGHFALETHAGKIGAAIKAFLAGKL